jgi:hypothetical protein
MTEISKKPMRNKHYNLSIFLIFTCSLLITVGCEGYECSNGVVYDLVSKEPIDSVLCVSNGRDNVYTDSFGRYDEICSPFGGCMPKCSELEIEFSKEGYKNHKETNQFDTIYLERVDTVNLEF